MTEQTPSGPNFEAPGNQAPPSSWVPPTGPAVISGQYPSNYAPVPGPYSAQQVFDYVSGTTAGLFVLFAVLGTMGTLRRIR